MIAEVIMGTWFGAAVTVGGGAVHAGDWTEVRGWWGEVRTRCGIAATGYLTGLSPNCEQCREAT